MSTIRAYTSENVYYSSESSHLIETFLDNIFMYRTKPQFYWAVSVNKELSYLLQKISPNNIGYATPTRSGGYVFSLGRYGEAECFCGVLNDGTVVILVDRIILSPAFRVFLNKEQTINYYLSAALPHISRATTSKWRYDKDLGFGFQLVKSPDGFFNIIKKGYKKLLCPWFAKVTENFSERMGTGDYFLVFERKDGKLQAFGTDGMCYKMNTDWLQTYSNYPYQYMNKQLYENRIVSLSESDLRIMIKDCVRKIMTEYKDSLLLGWKTKEKTFRNGGASDEIISKLKRAYDIYAKETAKKGLTPNAVGFDMWRH